MTAIQAADQSLSPAQIFIVTAEAAPVMAGDKQIGTAPLGSALTMTKLNGNWRYSAAEKGWIHVRDLVSLPEAHKKFTAEIAEKPTPRSYQLRGISLMAQEEWAKAAQDFEKAYDLGQSAVAIHLNLATCYERLGELPAALEEYNQILKTYPDDLSASLARGQIHLQQGQFPAALRDFEKGVEVDPQSADAQNSRGVALRMLGRYEEAVDAYTKTLDIDPKRADALANRGYARKNLGQLQEALKDYEAAVELAPDSSAIGNDLAWMLATTPDSELRNPSRAVEIAEKVCQKTKNENGEYLDTLAAAYASQERFPAAIETARLALTVMGDNPGKAKTQERLELYQKQQPYIETVVTSAQVVPEEQQPAEPKAE
ncbi:tetratricopeptide repeat protein [Planctomicrobium sp. SH661]|uniref:tetratricopeptide repeat protein n=1 Tax=Planctomicrobium sp. SH661 TaxID=3448124 RepID=UPI003F5AF297